MKEPFIAYIICFILTVLCILSQSFGSPIFDIAWFIAILSLIAIPLFIVRRLHPRDEAEAGVQVSLNWRDFLTGLIVLFALFIPVALGNHFVRTEIQHLTFHFAWTNYDSLKTPLIFELFIQLFAVALPEEFFYRGYLQTAFLQYFKLRPKTARFAPIFAIVLASLCFALMHWPSGNATRLLTFFPGLLFGTLRYKTGGLLGAIVCHAGCNMMMNVMNVHYL